MDDEYNGKMISEDDHEEAPIKVGFDDAFAEGTLLSDLAAARKSKLAEARRIQRQKAGPKEKL